MNIGTMDREDYDDWELADRDEYGTDAQGVKMETNYPADMDNRDRVLYVIHRLRSTTNFEVIAARSDTDEKRCETILQDLVREGKVTPREDGYRINPYYRACREIDREIDRVEICDQ